VVGLGGMDDWDRSQVAKTNVDGDRATLPDVPSTQKAVDAPFELTNTVSRRGGEVTAPTPQRWS